MKPETVFTAIAVLTAIASTAIAFMALRTQREMAKLQSRANVVSASRQRWIDALRDDIAEFLTVDAEFKGFDAHKSFSPKVNLESVRERDRILARQMLLLKRIRLRLNPKEADHTGLVAQLNKLVTTPRLESGLVAEDVIELAQKILKDEWKRVVREASGDVKISSPSF